MITKSHIRARGFTLLEVLVSMGLFSVAAIALAQAFSHQLSFNTTSEIRGSAIMAAQQVLDEYRVDDPIALPNSGSAAPQNVVIGNRTFSVVIRFCVNGALCTSPTVRHLTAEVNYQNSLIYTVETIYAQLR